MRLKLAAAALLLIPSPALADVTAHYVFHGGAPGVAADPAKPPRPLTIELDSNGDARAAVEGKFVLIRRDGVDYIALPDTTGQLRVARAAEVLALFVQANPEHGAPTMETTAKGEATVAGYSGSVWAYAPERQPPLELTMSTDPALAPFGDFFRSEIGAAADLFGKNLDQGNNVAESLHALLAKGTPIRIAPLFELESIDTAEIDPHRFDLPGPVMPAEAFMAAISPPKETPATVVETPAPPGH